MNGFAITTHERIAASAVARQLAIALRQQADAADHVARIAAQEAGGDGGYPNELPYFDHLVHTCGVLRNALYVLRDGPQGTFDTQTRIEGEKPRQTAPVPV